MSRKMGDGRAQSKNRPAVAAAGPKHAGTLNRVTAAD
jgi:hypothetical protein